MARPKKVEQPADIMDETLAKNAKLPIEDMPLTTFAEYRAYNEEARKHNKKLKVCRYPIKQCPVELHPHDRVVFSRNDQPSNPLHVHLSNEDIHFDKKLYPGQTYDLPWMIVEYLASKGVPVWKWFDNADGSKETRISHKAPRFSLRTVHAR